MRVELHWVPVTDADGRQRMEMRWTALRPVEPFEPEHVLAA